jgi:hypothetical protein
MEFLAVVVLVLGLIGASILRRHLREAKQVRLRQIIHEERLKAMEHNVPLPDVDDTGLARQLEETTNPAGGAGRGGLALAVAWIRIVALCIGLASFFGGIGTAIGMYVIKDPEISDYWAVGLIAVFIGLGLLIFYWMSRSLAGMVEEKA